MTLRVSSFVFGFAAVFGLYTAWLLAPGHLLAKPLVQTVR
jgi:hypothetical protein